MSIVLHRPDMARARPSSLIKRDEEYIKLFSHSYPIEVYRVCVDVIKRTSAYLNTVAGIAASDKTNLKFYIAMAASRYAVRKHEPTINDLATLATSGVEDSAIATSFGLVAIIYTKLGGTDQVAKGTELLSRINESLREEFSKEVQDAREK